MQVDLSNTRPSRVHFDPLGKGVLDYSEATVNVTEGIHTNLGAGLTFNLAAAIPVGKILSSVAPIKWDFGQADQVKGQRFGGLSQYVNLIPGFPEIFKDENAAVSGVVKVIGSMLKEDAFSGAGGPVPSKPTNSTHEDGGGVPPLPRNVVQFRRPDWVQPTRLPQRIALEVEPEPV